MLATCMAGKSHQSRRVPGDAAGVVGGATGVSKGSCYLTPCDTVGSLVGGTRQISHHI